MVVNRARDLASITDAMEREYLQAARHTTGRVGMISFERFRQALDCKMIAVVRMWLSQATV